MIARNFQSDIDGKLSELIKDDKSRFMNRVDYKEYSGTGPLRDHKGLIYKINLPDGFVTVTLTAKENEPELPIVRIDIDRHGKVLQREFDKGSYDDRYQLAYIVYREVCKGIESSKTIEGIEDEFDLTDIS